MARNRIRRGIVVPGYVKPKAGLHDGLYFLYRPMLPEEAGDLDDRLYRQKNAAGAPTTRILCECAADRIKWWSETEGNGDMAPITKETVGELPLSLWDHVIGIVRGLIASDTPEVGSEEEKGWIEASRKAEEMNQSPGAAIVEAIRGN